MILVWNILKVIGIILLCILALLILFLVCVLFVPIRYRLKAVRNVLEEEPVKADIKIHWLLHLVTATFIYPTQSFLKIKVLGIPIYSSEKNRQAKEADIDDVPKPQKDSHGSEETVQISEIKTEHILCEEKIENSTELETELEERLSEQEDEPTILKFIKKLFNLLKNIKYTILKLYDKIKKIISDIRYYIAIIKSDCFQRTFTLCKKELFLLTKSVFPKKIKGDLLVGTGDPASTAQILAIHGMLYPILGNHINITPDFENAIFEGNIFIKGNISVFRILKTAIKIYFNKDLRKVIRLLKREAV